MVRSTSSSDWAGTCSISFLSTTLTLIGWSVSVRSLRVALMTIGASLSSVPAPVAGGVAGATGAAGDCVALGSVWARVMAGTNAKPARATAVALRIVDMRSSFE